MENIRLSVPGISCHHCVRTIICELSELEGVNHVEADVETKDVSVVFTSPATPELIKKKLIEINYPASIV